jgi:uncharacterized protein (TIGR03437 family)
MGGASFGTAGVVSPGQIVTVFGTGLGDLRGSGFTLDTAGRVPRQLAGPG